MEAEEPRIDGIVVVKLTGLKSTDFRVDKNSSAGELVTGAAVMLAVVVVETCTSAGPFTSANPGLTFASGLAVCAAFGSDSMGNTVEVDSELVCATCTAVGVVGFVALFRVVGAVAVVGVVAVVGAIPSLGCDPSEDLDASDV